MIAPFNRKGFTLVELMIALFLGGIVLVSVLHLMSTVRKILMHQEAILSIQESMQTSLFILGNAIRTAGHMGCMTWQERPLEPIEALDSIGLASHPGIRILQKEALKKYPWISTSTLANIKPNTDILWIVSSEPCKGYKPGDILISPHCQSLTFVNTPLKGPYRRLTSTLYYISRSHNLYCKEFNRNATGYVEGVSDLKIQLTQKGVRVDLTFEHIHTHFKWQREWSVR